MSQITNERSHTLADERRMALSNLLRQCNLERAAASLREGVLVLSQVLMELEVSHHVGADTMHAGAERAAQWRPRAAVGTRMGTSDLRVPRVRDGSGFPSLLAPYERAERALVALVQRGLRARRLDPASGRFGQALGLQG